ncbi:MAG: aspartyl protease [Planctomycetes bacterium]|nr:aspartyl protease [Planctomycetota bacterium]
MFVAGEIPGETVFQAARLQALGIAPHSSRDFTLAHGERVTRRLGTALFEYQGRRGDSLVLFGEEGDAALVGATTLEGFGLVLDPFRRELRALPMLLV